MEPHRLLIISKYYPKYLKTFYDKRPELAAEPYAIQHTALMGDCFRWADFISQELHRLGHEATDVVANAEPMQKAWARENGIGDGDEPWILPILFAQIRSIRPDVLLVGEWHPEFGPDFVKHCRNICPAIKLVIGWCGEAHPDAAYFREHDLALSCAPDTVEDLDRQGIRAVHLNHAFEPRILGRLQNRSNISRPGAEIGFIGQVEHGEAFHNRRAILLDALATRLSIELYGDVAEVRSFPVAPGMKRKRELYFNLLEHLDRTGMKFVMPYLPKHQAYLENQNHEKLRQVFARLHQMAKPPVFGLEMFGLLAQLKVSLNAHGPSRYASNMRLYEATGVGACLLTDLKPNLHTIFEPDTEVVTYNSTEECIEKAQYLLDHESKRREIAANGQRRTLRDHTFTQRAGQLHEIISQALRRHPITATA